MVSQLFEHFVSESMALRLFLLCLALVLIVLKEGLSDEEPRRRCYIQKPGYDGSFEDCSGSSCARVVHGKISCVRDKPKLGPYIKLAGQCKSTNKSYMHLSITGSKFQFSYNCLIPVQDCNYDASDLEKKYRKCIWPLAKLDRPECACNSQGMDFRKSHEARVDGLLQLGPKGEEAVRKTCRDGIVSTREVRLLMYNELDIFQQLYFGCFVTKNDSKGLFIFSQYTYA